MARRLIRNIQAILIALALCAIVFGVFYVSFNLSLEERIKDKINKAGNGKIISNSSQTGNWIESSNWIITSYGDVNEALYTEEKIRVYDKDKNFLGLYRLDFLEKVIINGAGVGNGIGNDKKKFLHYDYNIDDQKTYYLSDYSLGAFNNPLVPWTGQNPSIAINPSLPQGTKVRFKDLGNKENSIPESIKNLMLNKTFFVDDKFYGFKENEKKIDIYVGLIQSRDYGEQSLYMENVTILISPQ